MQFYRNSTYILTRTQAKKFEDIFLIKIASTGTSLNHILILHKTSPSHTLVLSILRISHLFCIESVYSTDMCVRLQEVLS